MLDIEEEHETNDQSLDVVRNEKQRSSRTFWNGRFWQKWNLNFFEFFEAFWDITQDFEIALANSEPSKVTSTQRLGHCDDVWDSAKWNWFYKHDIWFYGQSGKYIVDQISFTKASYSSRIAWTIHMMEFSYKKFRMKKNMPNYEFHREKPTDATLFLGPPFLLLDKKLDSDLIPRVLSCSSIAWRIHMMGSLFQIIKEEFPCC